MRTFILSLVCCIGVLCPGVMGGDAQCFAEKKLVFSISLLNSTGVFCSEAKPFTSRIMDGSKTCGYTKMNVSKLNEYIDEFCNINSNLRKQFNQSKACFLENKLYGINCLPDIPTLDKDALGEYYKELCKDKTFDSVFACVNEFMGKACGNDGLQVVKRFTDAYSIYTNSMCLEINGSPSMTSISSYILMLLLAIYAMWK